MGYEKKPIVSNSAVLNLCIVVLDLIVSNSAILNLCIVVLDLYFRVTLLPVSEHKPLQYLPVPLKA